MMESDLFSERIQELEGEFERGQEQIALLDERRAELRDTLLRISGAIQVLKELSAQARPEPALVTSTEAQASP